MARRKQKIRRYRYVGDYSQSRWRKVSRLLLLVGLATVLFWAGWTVASHGIGAITDFWRGKLPSAAQSAQPDTESEQETDAASAQAEEETEETAVQSAAAQSAAQQKQETVPQEDGEGIFAPIALSAWSSEDTLRSALREAKQAGADRALVTVKDERGYIYYDSAVALAQTAGAVRSEADLALFVRLCKEEGLLPCARMYVFQDPLAAYADRTMAVWYQQEGVIWLDNYPEQGGQPWLSPYSVIAREYAAELAAELAQSGMQEIVFAGVQFPGGYAKGDCYYGTAAATVSYTDCLAECVAMLQNAAGQAKSWFQYPAAQAFQPEDDVVGAGGLSALGAGRLLLSAQCTWDVDGQQVLPDCDADSLCAWSSEVRGKGTDYLALDVTVLQVEKSLAESWLAAAREAGFAFFVQ